MSFESIDSVKSRNIRINSAKVILTRELVMPSPCDFND